jgi:aldehyde dehydrogenase (NAD+)
LPRSRYEEGLEQIEASFRSFPWGDPNEMTSMMGPVVSRRQLERVEGYIKQGIEEGARLVVGGIGQTRFDKGFYVEPTLFAVVDNSMIIARDEIFGPVLVVIPYDDDDDAIRIANDSPYGLAASVYGSTDRATNIARRLRVGAVSVGSGMVHNADTPFGGFKQSGFGRQNGVEGFEQYLEVKALGLPAA